jgi:hypothetical protein
MHEKEIPENMSATVVQWPDVLPAPMARIWRDVAIAAISLGTTDILGIRSVG